LNNFIFITFMIVFAISLLITRIISLISGTRNNQYNILFLVHVYQDLNNNLILIPHLNNVLFILLFNL
jgi:hypothetical protein